MKIGLIFVSYQSERLPGVLAPWVLLKHGAINDSTGLKEVEKPKDIDIKICAVSALFKEYADLGQKYSNDYDSEVLSAYEKSKAIDKYIEYKERPILDFESRNIAFNYLNSWKPDLYWQLDSDEFYNYQEILNAINYIKNNNLFDYYRIRFKNFFGKESDKTYVTNFNPTRIIWNIKNNGVKKWRWDNDVDFNNGARTPETSNITIPQSIISPRHYSWTYRDSPDKIIQKINYQHKAIGCCSYKFDDGKLNFDNQYYLRIGQSLPKINIDE